MKRIRGGVTPTFITFSIQVTYVKSTLQCYVVTQLANYSREKVAHLGPKFDNKMTGIFILKASEKDMKI